MQPHWPIPRRILGIPIRSLIFNRLVTSALPPYYTGREGKVGGAIVRPLQRAVWWSLEKVITGMFKLDDNEKQRLPALQLPKDMFFGGQV